MIVPPRFNFTIDKIKSRADESARSKQSEVARKTTTESFSKQKVCCEVKEVSHKEGSRPEAIQKDSSKKVDLQYYIRIQQAARELEARRRERAELDLERKANKRDRRGSRRGRERDYLCSAGFACEYEMTFPKVDINRHPYPSACSKREAKSRGKIASVSEEAFEMLPQYFCNTPLTPILCDIH